jgi:benzoyl-CoA reductase/2-hydroxyglutaryl-CoA dehydratase subunit BcrC/BadD/HgdB
MPTYQEIRDMWAELGMDLPAHDNYVNAFPARFKQIILGQQNRPEEMAYFTGVVKSLHGARPYELHQHRQAGGKVVGTYCVYVPDEVVYALGAISTGLCGGDQFWVPGGEKFLPANTCALIKSSVGSRLDRTSPFCQVADLFVGETTCDGKKKAWEILGQDVPLHVIDVPQMKRDRDVARFADEIRDFIGALEDLTGQTLTAEDLGRGIRLINERRLALQRLHDSRRAASVPISGLDALMITQIAFYDDPERFVRMTDKLCDELDQRIARGQGVFPPNIPCVLITGSPMAAPNWKVPHLVETLGGAVVVEEMCTGSRYYENPVEDVAPDLDAQITALARRYMKTNCACFTPNPGRIEDVLRLVETYRVDGVIDYCLQFCGLYTTESFLLRETLQQEGIPVLRVETDYGPEDVEQLRTRIGAFIEMLRS